ncbi:5-carboxymethyl-2-hydroxymuconate isomerase [Rhodoferax sp. OV413]|uniref:5-carboxymethyl-2-hydroxymuconate Delta-isomerase n=1 Tax=Rhodoferax sp. OV413 TaxID=1855285 RepID=UPI00088CA055|nr:5-carboxymethyl-2-hydroxymuconate Delta-isomerase [Rhodoferax sp. OV413]SDP21167.1 5-carboxymethyl-2-hydroxymuconate isomerase [Rhodoferax sp. OV413]
MPHLVILYTGQLDKPADQGGSDIGQLCRSLADTMLGLQDDAGKQLFPTGGTRVFAYPAAHYAVADGSGDHAFVYLNLRMSKGRSEATQQRAGEALLTCTRAHFAPIFDQRPIGITLQIDVGAEVFDGKHNNLHPLFHKS